jgi:hypothetical protein
VRPAQRLGSQGHNLPDPFSIEQAAVDVTGFGLQLVEMGQAAVAAQVVG